SSRRRHTRFSRDWSSDVCSSDLCVQLHTLNHRQTQTDNPQPTQSWLFDIPVRYGPEVHQLEIRIDQEWTAEDKDERDQRDRVKRSEERRVGRECRSLWSACRRTE